MRIAFYAPLKSSDHPVPSGDRLMARLLVEALALAGHTVEIASRLRSFTTDPANEGHVSVRKQAKREIARLTAEWTASGAPDLWFCYHPYYKAPDFIGPALAAAFSIPYITAEASYAAKRDTGPWAGTQTAVVDAVGRAALNICFTSRDREGLSRIAAPGSLAMLAPFIDVSPFGPPAPGSSPPVLVTVAMMRPGDKLASYRMLGQALSHCADLPFRVVVVGDGPCREEVNAAFAGLAPSRIDWLGERPPEDIPAILAGGDIFVWPGFGEAYGLAYLEAQAAGLPVIAQHAAGVPEVVRDGATGILTPEGDVEAYAAAIASLLADDTRRKTMALAARRFVFKERSLAIAARTLSNLLQDLAA